MRVAIVVVAIVVLVGVVISIARLTHSRLAFCRYYRRLRARFEAFHAAFDPADAIALDAALQRPPSPSSPPAPWPRGVPDPADSGGGGGAAELGRWSILVGELLEARDDLSLVARLTRAQRLRLRASTGGDGAITTRAQLAALARAPPAAAPASSAAAGGRGRRPRDPALGATAATAVATGIPNDTLARLARQAALQLRAVAERDAAAAAHAAEAAAATEGVCVAPFAPPPPPFELLPGAFGRGALGALPPASLFDVYFDLEGDPFGGMPSEIEGDLDAFDSGGVTPAAFEGDDYEEGATTGDGDSDGDGGGGFGSGGGRVGGLTEVASLRRRLFGVERALRLGGGGGGGGATHVVVNGDGIGGGGRDVEAAAAMASVQTDAPVAAEDAPPRGREYLWGVSTHGAGGVGAGASREELRRERYTVDGYVRGAYDANEPRFVRWWAHDTAAEHAAFGAFVEVTLTSLSHSLSACLLRARVREGGTPLQAHPHEPQPDGGAHRIHALLSRRRVAAPRASGCGGGGARAAARCTSTTTATTSLRRSGGSRARAASATSKSASTRRGILALGAACVCAARRSGRAGDRRLTSFWRVLSHALVFSPSPSPSL